MLCLHLIHAPMSYYIDIMLQYVVLIQYIEYYCNYNDYLMILTMILCLNDILFMLIELISFTNHVYCILFHFRGVVSASVSTSDHLCLM